MLFFCTLNLFLIYSLFYNLGVLYLSRYNASVFGEVDSVVELVNQNQNFVISGTTDVPNGSIVELRMGIHRRFSKVVNGEFSVRFDRKVKVQDYNAILFFRTISKLKLLRKNFILRVKDTIAPGKIPVSSFSSSKAPKDSMLISWLKPSEMFEVQGYLVYKNGILLEAPESPRYTVVRPIYVTGPMEMTDIDAYRIRTIDNSNNVSAYSLGFAVSRQESTTAIPLSPVLTIIDPIRKVYGTTTVEGEIVVTPIIFSYSDLFNNSDICDLTRAGENSGQLHFTVTSIESNVGTFKLLFNGVLKVLEVDDLISKGSSIVWTPSEKFEGNQELLTFKAMNGAQLLSPTSASLYVNLI